LDIAIVPCQVLIGEQNYRDRVDLSPEEFYVKLAQSEELPRTSQPLMQDFVNTYRQVLEGEPEATIVSIHVPGKFSGTVNGAWAAAQSLPDPSRVEVIDSGQISMGMGWAVIEAARMARSGMAHREVVDAVRVLLPRLRTAAMLDTLDNLYKGGRISQITAVLGTALQIKPLLSVDDGDVTVWGRVRTRSRALNRLVDYVRSWGPLVEMAILHTDAKDLADSLVGALEDLIPSQQMVFEAAGPALTTHLGLGAVGVCALTAPELV
jgi:DegV family protein with EDD domain